MASEMFYIPDNRWALGKGVRAMHWPGRSPRTQRNPGDQD
jgi:hypothetical protein